MNPFEKDFKERSSRIGLNPFEKDLKKRNARFEHNN